MIIRVPIIRFAVFAATGLVLGACGHVEITHVPPGQSLGVALARKPTLVRMPASAGGANGAQTASAGSSEANPNAGVREGDRIAKTAEAFSRGEFCMNAGNDDEAIAAFQEVVKTDPSFTEAWQRLAALYEKKGDNQKAMEAFKRSKKIASQ
jgi:tetratricopeptide (TPR) repeat protein